MLTEHEKTGILILALFRGGEIKGFDCSTCPAQKREQLCQGGDGDKGSVYYHKMVGEFHDCPMVFVPESILSFIDRYDFIKEFTVAMDYDTVNMRFWEAVKYYQKCVNDIDSQEEDKTDTTNESMSKMAGLFKKG